MLNQNNKKKIISLYEEIINKFKDDTYTDAYAKKKIVHNLVSIKKEIQ